MANNPPSHPPPVQAPADITELLIAVARIEERQIAQNAATIAQIENANHRHSNLKMIIEGLATKKDVEVVEERVDKIETNQSRVVWGVMGLCGLSLSSLLGLTKKLGL